MLAQAKTAKEARLTTLRYGQPAVLDFRLHV